MGEGCGIGGFWVGAGGGEYIIYLLIVGGGGGRLPVCDEKMDPMVSKVL